jgi:hypothetical protein
MMNQNELTIYTAGLFDGEGHVQFRMRTAGLSRGLPRYGQVNAALDICNTDIRPLTLIQQEFGGRMSTNRKLGSRRLAYELSIQGKDALVFAKAILPYSLIKAEQLQLFIDAVENGKVGQVRKLTDDIIELRARYSNDLLALRAIGVEG